MTQVTINGHLYSDDGSTPGDMLNGGHRTHFMPLVEDVVVVANQVAEDAVSSAAAATIATNVANATRGTSTTSLPVIAGIATFTTDPGKQFQPGNFITIARTSAPTTLMHGVVTAYNPTTGVTSADVTTINGSGTFTDWTIALSGAKGNAGPTGNGSVAYLPKTAAYTVTAADKGKLIDCTNGPFTLSFQACASLGADWITDIRNSGTGVITLDPNGSETIDGSPTFALNPGSVARVQCNGTVLRIEFCTLTQLIRLPVFDPSAASALPASVLETMENSLVASGLTTSATFLAYGAGLFLASSGGASNASIASSPDGITWTSRAMPSAAAWAAASDGTSKFVATVPGATTIANSTNGTTWASATALPAASKATYGIPVFNGGTCLVLGATASTAYTSIDNGANWVTQTLPAAAGNMAPFVVGGLFWFWSAAGNAYTSPTGATGSWTLRPMPITPDGMCLQDFDGALIAGANATSTYYRSTDGINWNALAVPPIAGVVNSSVLRSINGVFAAFATTLGNAGSYHGSKWCTRKSLVGDSTASHHRCAKNAAGTIFLLPHNSGTTGQVGRISPLESTAATALFTR